MRPRKTGLDADLDEMLRMAMKQPGVAETMKMYEEYGEVVAVAKGYLRMQQPRSIVSDYSS